MNTPKTILCLDPGTGSLKQATFAWDEAGGLRLTSYSIKPRGIPGRSEAAGDAAASEWVRELVEDQCGRAAHCHLCVPAAQVFAKFLKLPAVDGGRLSQAVRYEAMQHFPFPLEELTWDYQVLKPSEGDQVRVLLAALKSATAEQWIQAAERASCRVDLMDAGPVALVNAFRYSYGDLPGCSLLLDIGARTTTILLLEGENLFFRKVNLGGNTITSEFAAEAKLPPAEAERAKLEDGMVGLAGPYEEADDPRQAVLAKVARQFMTRLHAQVTQTIQFFRQQQGGAPPQRLYLAGAGSGLPYTAQFFREKLNLPVEYFNPFRRLVIDPSLDRESLARVAPVLGGLVGLALRGPLRCPLELNLIPASVLKRRQHRRVGHYVGAAVASLVVALWVAGWCYDQVATQRQKLHAAQQKLAERLSFRDRKLKAALAQRNRSARAAEQLTAWMRARFYWADLLTDLRRVLEATESATTRGDIRGGIWIETMTPELPEEPVDEETAPQPFLDPRVAARYWGSLPGLPAGWQSNLLAAAQGGAGTPRKPDPATNQISAIQLTCRAVSWNRVSPTADTELAFAFLKQLQASPFAATGTNGTCLLGLMQQDALTGTFSFNAKLVLKDPIQL